jgi:hypothetical protein
MDSKPENIIMFKDPDCTKYDVKFKLADFGVSSIHHAKVPKECRDPSPPGSQTYGS